jgi:hypothetical protein
VGLGKLMDESPGRMLEGSGNGKRLSLGRQKCPPEGGVSRNPSIQRGLGLLW